eukprot:Hpha_TRINITY_DN16482_c0_g3::TRINITY_DN16482_c0_g3_i1::g.163362::m.163362
MADDGRTIDWMPGMPNPTAQKSASLLAKSMMEEMDQAYERLSGQRTAGEREESRRYCGVVMVSQDGDQLCGDGCSASQLCSLDPDTLEEVTDVSICESELGEQGCAKLGEWVLDGKIPELESVDLSSSTAGPAGVAKLCNALAKGAPCLEVLTLDGSFKQDEPSCEALVSLLADSPKLRELSLFSCFFDDVSTLAIAQGMVNAVALEQLSLDWNMIGPEGALALAEAMRGNWSLRRLDLGHNRLLDAGAATLLSMLDRATRIQQLGLDSNGIRSLEGARPDCLCTSGLRTLVLNGNHLGPSGATTLATLLKTGTSSLTALYLSKNSLGDDGTSVILAALTEMGAMGIKSLDIAGNGLTVVGAAYVADFMKDERSRLVRLDMRGNPIGEEGWDVLRGALPGAVSLRWLTVRNCGLGDEVRSQVVRTPQGDRVRIDVKDGDGESGSDEDE